MKTKIQYVINIIFGILIFVIASFFILGECILPKDTLEETDACKVYTGRWVRILESGEEQPVEIPGRCDAERNEVVVIQTVLPATIENGRYLCFRSAKQDMRFYIDGELRQEYSTDKTRLFGGLSAAAYVFLELDSGDAGKTLRVETQTDSSYSGIFYDVYYGNPMGIWNYFYDQFGMELTASFITLLLSVITVLASLVLRFKYHRKVSIEYLGWGTLAAAVWLITNSTFRQLIFPNLSVVNDMTFLMVIFMPFPFLLYMNEIQRGRYQKVYNVMEGVVIISFLLFSSLHIIGCRDFTDTIIYTAAICIISIILMVVTFLLDFWKGYVKRYSYVAVGMSGVFVAAVVQIFIYFRRENEFNGVILAIGLIFLLIFAVMGTVREILHMDREMQRALHESESKGRFLANMSHEIRTPINTILGMNAMILRESQEKEIKEYALDIQNAGQVLLSLINDILDISKIESGKLNILLVEYDVSSLIHDVINMIGIKAQDKGLELNLSLDENMPSVLLGDDVRIRQILLNLMNNAVKYTEEGSVTLTVKADVKDDIVDLTFRVEDTGIGIREEDIEKLFHEFERIDEQRNRNIEGTGLGISIVIRLLENMDSKLHVQSEYGKGSVFYFTLRQKIINHEPIGNLEERIQNQTWTYSYQVMFTAPQAQILVVDDNAINRKVFRNLLKSTRIKIDEAVGGEQCLEYVREKAYDLIFLDHMMPDLNGIEVLHKMREWKDYPCKDTPVIALTANTMTGSREMFLAEGFYDFLPKPVNPEKLEKMIQETLPESKVIYTKGEPVFSETEKNGENDSILPELEGIDWKYARIYCQDLDMLLDTIHLFYDTIESEAEQLEELLAKLDEIPNYKQAVGDYRVKVHSMKNSAAMIGAVSLSGVARLLEYAARDEKVDVIKNITPVFLKEWRKMQEVLKPVVEEEKQSKGTIKPDKERIKEFLRLLRDAMAKMDVDTADEIMRQLKTYEYTADIMTDVMEKLNLAVINLDEEQTTVWTKEFERRLGEE